MDGPAPPGFTYKGLSRTRREQMTLETETLSGGQANQAGINLELFRLVALIRTWL